MINIFKKIEQIKNDLEKILNSKSILNFHLALRLNNEIYIYLLCDEDNAHVKAFIEKYSANNIEIKIISEDEYNEDNYYQNIFKQDVNIKNSRRRFVHLLDENSDDKNLDTPCPVVTFYSYKGGMGRSTTLASFATALANGAIEYQGERISPKKVVIIDCDFEAPGFTNYFLNNSGVPYNQNGIVEYLTDSEFDKDIDIQKYMWDVAKDPYAGGGEIWVMPAGNLSTSYDTEDFLKNNLNHYLEGLARLDIASPMYLINRIKKDVIDKIYDKIKPDFILIDSRTGFNDIFGITALELSKVVVGFFGNNAQTHPGLHFFIDTLLKHHSVNGVIVNSILPISSSIELFEDFKESVDTILELIKENGDEYNLSSFKVSRNEILEKIGSKRENKNYFMNLINKRQFEDYGDLFDKIYDLSIDTQKLVEKKNILGEENTNTTQSFPPSVLENKLEGESPKMRILKNLQKDLPNLYADQLDDNGKSIDFQKELDDNRYFFRKCMEDLFNISRFLIIGNKGAGKSYIYESLKNKDIVNALQKRANKPKSSKYHFFPLIEYGDINFFVETKEFDDISKGNTEKYFSRFWKVFIWRSIMRRSKDNNLYISDLNLFCNCETETEISKRFNEIIQNEDKIILIEKDLLELDKFLNSKGGNEYIVAIFDPLDKLIKPDKWKDRIAPLIDFWRKRPYSKIFPKIFVRKDLLNTIGNINNFQENVNQAINIEWSKEELFAYFFTLVTSSSHRDFFDIMRQSQLNNSSLVEHIEKKTGQKKQFPIEENFLRLASSTFFGKYADRQGRDIYGESYDWIYKNLQNTDGSISLRPFIDLIECSIDDSLNNNNNSEAPILNPDFFTSGLNRKKAIKRYLGDLMNEQGNDDLKLFFEFFDDISKNLNDPNEKFLFLKQKPDQFDMLLKAIIQKYPNRIKNDVKGLKELLEQNGIVKRNSWDYSFALLYKYRLGLK